MLKLGVLNYSPSNHPGGINKFVKELAKSMVGFGVEVTVLEPESSSEEGASQPYLIKKIHRPRFSPPINLSKSFVKEVISWIDDEEPDLIHVNGHMHLLSHQAIRAIKKKSSVPIIFSPHYDVAASSWMSTAFLPIFNKTIGKNTVSMCDTIVFDSNFEMSAFERSLGIIGDNRTVIPLGVDMEINNSTAKWDDSLTLVYCGHFVKRKRVDRLIRLAYEISNKSPETLLSVIIVGTGPEEGKLRRLSMELGISEKISWRGFLAREEMISTIRNSDFFVLLSDSEAFGITVAEALSIGTGVVISDNTSLSEFSNEPGSMMVSNPDDFPSIASRILETEGLSRNIGPFSDKIRTWERTGLEYLELYKNIKGQ